MSGRADGAAHQCWCAALSLSRESVPCVQGYFQRGAALALARGPGQFDDYAPPVEQSLSLARTLEEHGVEYELMLVEGGQHSFAEMSTRTNALEWTFDFLHDHLADPVSANDARD
ncbi:S9 family peptidase [uncultured Curtobacterium sp.]|uniref:alpha/beta hydrolase family protein n=1 Tax=uncultured Curtobacterium sp. TaxID=331964 RepID=UPI0025873AD9|nr:prolyl oligopeptidase family serine peptidase [uncultured Curtobacterium sp.]